MCCCGWQTTTCEWIYKFKMWLGDTKFFLPYLSRCISTIQLKCYLNISSSSAGLNMLVLNSPYIYINPEKKRNRVLGFGPVSHILMRSDFIRIIWKCLIPTALWWKAQCWSSAWNSPDCWYLTRSPSSLKSNSPVDFHLTSIP